MLLDKEERQELLKIHKNNSLIFGRQKQLQAIDLKLFDVIYYKLQQVLKTYNEPPKTHLTLTIERNFLVELFDFTYEKWIRDVKQSLKRLESSKYELNDYGKYDWIQISLIGMPSILKTNQNHVGLIQIVVPDVIAQLAWERIKYTPLEVEKIIKLESKYTILLYEYIEAVRNYKKNNGDSMRQLPITFNDLKNIFGKPKVRFFSRLLQEVRFKEFLIKDLNKVIPCRYEVFAKDKMLVLYFEGSLFPDLL